MRILLPLALATVTLLPLDRVVIAWAINRSTVAMADLNPLMGSVLAGDRVGLQQRLSDAEEGSATPLGAWWPVLLPLSVFLLFPLGLATIGQRHWAVLLQPAYAWGISLGLIGLFRRCLAGPLHRQPQRQVSRPADRDRVVGCGASRVGLLHAVQPFQGRSPCLVHPVRSDLHDLIFGRFH